MAKEVILTGLRANSEFHLGNYLGAILPMVRLQQKHAGRYQLNMFVPDLHSFTTPIDHGKLFEQTHENLKVFVAAGLDIDQPGTFIYRQSYIPAHSELTWILDCFTGVGEMNNMTEFKDKSGRRALDGKVNNLLADLIKNLPSGDTTATPEELVKSDPAFAGRLLKTFLDLQGIRLRKEKINESISVGLFNYPVLMAADILIYGAKYVPVGEDQRQHVEFARDIAMRMNNKFGELFVLPADNAEQLKFSGREKPVRIRSLRNPEKKMSKSVEDPSGTIMLSDKPQDAADKIMSATTDSHKNIKYDFEKQPGVSNLLQILGLLSGKPQSEVNSQWEGKNNYSELKSAVAEVVKNFLTDLQTKLADVNEQKLMQKIEADEAAMNKVANQVLLKVQKAVGLRPS